GRGGSPQPPALCTGVDTAGGRRGGPQRPADIRRRPRDTCPFERTRSRARRARRARRRSCLLDSRCRRLDRRCADSALIALVQRSSLALPSAWRQLTDQPSCTHVSSTWFPLSGPNAGTTERFKECTSPTAQRTELEQSDAALEQLRGTTRVASAPSSTITSRDRCDASDGGLRVTESSPRVEERCNAQTRR